MAVQSTLSQIEEVQEAITAVMGGQSFVFDGVTYTRANLSVLEAREVRLKKQYAREQGARPPFKRVKFAGGYD
jgi:hypothetical protein